MTNDLDLKLRISQDGAEATAEHLGQLKKGFGEKAADIGELSDEWQSMKGRLDVVSDSQAAANANLEQVIGIGPIFTET